MDVSHCPDVIQSNHVSVARLHVLTVVGVVAALTLSLWTTVRAAIGTEPDERATVSLHDLVGGTVDQVQGRLGLKPAGDEAAPAFRIATPEGTYAFVSLGDLVQTPEERHNAAVYRTQGDPAALIASEHCVAEVLTPESPAPQPGGDVLLVFADGRLAYALAPQPPRTQPPFKTPASPAEMRALWLRPVVTPFVDAPGHLPLEDGAGFLTRLGRPRLGGETRFTASCRSLHPSPGLHLPTARHELDAGDLQGLALLPLAVTLPAKNHQRQTAREKGALTFSALRVGSMLGATPQAYASAHSGVRAYTGRKPGYAVISIDMGGYPGRNLTNFNDAALVGVQDDRVVWTSPPATNFGPSARLLCLDVHGVPAIPRIGCWGYGNFRP